MFLNVIEIFCFQEGLALFKAELHKKRIHLTEQDLKGPTYSYMKIGHISQNRVHRLQTNVELHGHGDIGMAQGQHFSENIKSRLIESSFLRWMFSNWKCKKNKKQKSLQTTPWLCDKIKYLLKRINRIKQYKVWEKLKIVIFSSCIVSDNLINLEVEFSVLGLLYMSQKYN